jgi:hypothetical protein
MGWDFLLFFHFQWGRALKTSFSVTAIRIRTFIAQTLLFAVEFWSQNGDPPSSRS